MNPTARARTGLVEVTLPGHGPVTWSTPTAPPVPTQVIGEISGEAYATMVTGQKVRWVLDLMRGTEFAGRDDHVVRDHRPRRRDGVHEIVLQEAGPGDARRDISELREQLLDLGTRATRASLRLLAAPLRRVLFDTGEIAGFGWSCFSRRPTATAPARDGHRARTDARERARAASRSTSTTGTYAIRTDGGLRAAGLGRLVDDGDGGDTYNYSPPAADLVIDAPDAVRVTALETGPVRARVQIDADYTWPEHAVGDLRSCSARSDETVPVTVTTTLELRAGERFLRVAHELDNRARDHRLRAHFPLPAPVDGSDAECAFTVVHRGLTAESGVHEHGLPTFPSRRFVDASDGTAGLALVHDGLLEYEVVDDGRELALTLLAGGRVPLPVRAARCARTPRARRCRSPARNFPAASAPSTRCCSTPATGAPPTATRAADALLVPFERARATGTATPAAPRAVPRCGSTAPRSPRCCDPRAAWSSGCSAPTPTPGPVTHRARRRARPRLGHRPPGPPGRALRRHRRPPPLADLHPPTHANCAPRTGVNTSAHGR